MSQPMYSVGMTPSDSDPMSGWVDSAFATIIFRSSASVVPRSLREPMYTPARVFRPGKYAPPAATATALSSPSVNRVFA